MTDVELLNQRIRDSGLKFSFIAQKMGLSYYGLRRKLNNLCEFKASEISSLCDILGITNVAEKEAIFFRH